MRPLAATLESGTTVEAAGCSVIAAAEQAKQDLQRLQAESVRVADKLDAAKAELRELETKLNAARYEKAPMLRALDATKG